MPEPPTYDRRHEEHCVAMEIYQEGVEAYWDELETEDLQLNLIHATGVDREVILELLEVRGMTARSVLSVMSGRELLAHFRDMTDLELLECSDGAARSEWDTRIYDALRYEITIRWRQLMATLPISGDLETVDVLAAEANLSRPFAGIARDLVSESSK
jgi:hypothetical protein